MIAQIRGNSRSRELAMEGGPLQEFVRCFHGWILEIAQQEKSLSDEKGNEASLYLLFVDFGADSGKDHA